MYRHASGPRTTVICIHGYRGGQLWIEERAFVARWLYSKGLDVALFTLPFHGKRSGADAPVWPSVNVGRANEGFAQAVHNLRALGKHLDAPSARRSWTACAKPSLARPTFTDGHTGARPPRRVCRETAA